MSTLVKYYDPTIKATSGVQGTGGAMNVNISTTIAGERNPTSTTNAYMAAVPEGNVTRLDIGTTETLVTNSPAILLAIIGNDANTGFTDLIDAASTGSGFTAKVRTNVADGESLSLHGMKFSNGICVDGESAAHDVSLVWRPQ